MSQWVDDHPLGAAMARRTLSSVRSLMTIAIEVGSVYATIHSKSVLHGDVHSGNILRDADAT